MSVLIAISQGFRIGAIWAKRQTTRQILMTASVMAYTLLLVNRENKISKYYDTGDRTKAKPGSGKN